MEKEQVVKALEICSNYKRFGDCGKCPASERCDTDGNFLERDALSIILEQEKRIEELTLENAGFEAGARHAAKFIKADTVRKMQDKVRKKIKKTDWLSGRAVYLAIDKIAKELLEDNS